MKINTRNVLKSAGKAVKEGIVNNGNTIQLAGGDEITSIMKTSSDNLSLKAGTPVITVIKAATVMVVEDHDKGYPC